MKLRLLLWIALTGLVGGCSIENKLHQPQPHVYPDSNPPGFNTAVVTDNIVHALEPAHDILFTIDNSGSMITEQASLLAAIPAFLDYFIDSGLDYHLGVTTTDITSSAGGLLQEVDGMQWVDLDTPDPSSVFQEMANVGTSGWSVECGLGATFLALGRENKEENWGFVRDDAALHTVIISDEADQTSTTLIEIGDFKEWYAALKPSEEYRTFNTIVNATGARYQEVLDYIGGETRNILEGINADVLLAVGENMFIQDEYFLSQSPIVETIQVTLELNNGTVIVPDWEYSDPKRNSIRIISAMPAGIVSITYQVNTGEQDGITQP